MYPKCANTILSAFLVATIIFPDLLRTMFAKTQINIMSHAHWIVIIVAQFVKETILRLIKCAYEEVNDI